MPARLTTYGRHGPRAKLVLVMAPGAGDGSCRPGVGISGCAGGRAESGASVGGAVAGRMCRWT